MVRRRRVLSWTTFLASLAALAVVASAGSMTTTDDSATLSVAKKHSSSTKSSSSSTISSSSSSSSSHTTKTGHHATPTVTHPPPIACDPLPLNLSPADLCAHITANCPSNGRIDYLDLYYCSPLPDETDPGGGGEPADHVTPYILIRRSLAMLSIILWMSFLFSCLGLVASDFFCPNLSTLASRLGLNESTAGVTFLALGNGSPDVFSTFSAMSTGSGALAVGELIGAASFIVSVVAGSMMLIQPFRVRRYPFIRDVGFFTVAVALTLACLVDGHLTLAESLALVGLYLAYATVVIVGSMWEERQRRKRVAWERTRSDWRATPGYQDEVVVGDRLQVDEGQYGGALHSPLPPRSPEYHVDEDDGGEADLNADPFEVWASQQAASPRPVPGSNAAAPATPASAPHRPPSSSRSSSRRNSPSTSPLLTPTGSRSGIGLPASSRLVRSASSKLRSTSVHHMPRHSLLGAVEFRDVVRSLTLQGQLAPLDDVAAEAQARAVAESRDPEAFLPHHHAHHHHHHHQRGGHQRRHSHMNGAGSAPQQQQQEQSSPSSQASSSSRPAPSAQGYSAPPPPGRGHQQNSFSLDVTSIDDPWKEHSANDGCDDAAGPSAPARAAGAGHNAGSSSLSRLAIPDQSQADYHLAAAAASKGNGGGEGKPTQSSKPSPAPSILILDENGQERVALAASPAGLDSTPSPACCKPTTSPTSPGHRHRSPSSSPSSPRSTLRSLRRHLFPSLHHWRDKSILGKILSVVNAPPLLIFNLTLPVVDDEAEARAAARLGDGEEEGTTASEAYAEAEGAVRLKGNGETPLFARRAGDVGAVDEDAHEVDDEEVLDLATGKRSRPHNVWDHDCDHAAGGAADEEDDAKILDNKKRDLRVSRALRRLPAEETSPLTFGGGGDGSLGHGHDENGIARPTSPTPSTTSSSTTSTSSTTSHSPLPTGNAKLLLTTSQCLLAPTFCVWAATDLEPRGSLVLSLLVGVALAGGVVACTLRARRVGGAWLGRGTVSAFGLARCFLGFLVSIAFISVIVDEVVSILQALGLILGLSEAILGVTLFAMGNSLADLVANTVISRAGFPSMAIAACFAGPLLNLLLGIGASGTWLLSRPGVEGSDGQYHFEISPTLLTSGVGLLVLLVGTLVLVPLNGFYLGRRLGWLLIGSYGVIMTINVLVEIFVDQRQGKGGGKGGKHHHS